MLAATPKQQTVIQLEHTVLTLRQSLKLCPRSLDNGAYQKRNINHFEVFRMNQQGPNSRSFPQKKKSHLVFSNNKERKKKEGVFLLVLCNYTITYVNSEKRIFLNFSRSQFPNKTKINIMLRTIQITSMTSSVPFAPVISWRKKI